MEKRKSLAEIKRLFRKKKFAKVVELLEPEIFRYRDSYQYYSLLGLSCLRLLDGGGAFSYLNRALQLKEDDVSSLLGLAMIHLKKRNIDDALRLWLRVLEIDPSNRVAKRGLERVRKGMSEDQLSLMIDSGKVKLFYPPIAGRFSLRVPLLVLLAVGLLVGGYFALTSGLPYLETLLPKSGTGTQGSTTQPPRQDVESVQLSRDALRTDFNAKARFTFTETEVDGIWKTAKDYFTVYRDNLAVVALNRLLNSNASSYIKESARRLKSFTKTPGFKDILNFQDNLTFRQVADAPYLYDGCFVLWRGTIANLLVTAEAISFQFLVGSYDNKTFEGDVPVVFDFADKFENNYYIELLGKVVNQGEKFVLKGVLNRRLAVDSTQTRSPAQ